MRDDEVGDTSALQVGKGAYFGRFLNFCFAAFFRCYLWIFLVFLHNFSKKHLVKPKRSNQVRRVFLVPRAPANQQCRGGRARMDVFSAAIFRDTAHGLEERRVIPVVYLHLQVVSEASSYAASFHPGGQRLRT